MITERDIFNYIYFPHLVDDEKKRILETSSEYNSLIDFYKSVKNVSEKPLSDNIKHDLSLKINIYNHLRFFRLKRVDVEKPRKPKELTILAAASEKEANTITAKSFLDEEHKFLIRVIKTGESTKIYTFSSDEKIIRNFKLKVLPSGKEFILNDNSHPLEIKEELEFDEVYLELV